VCRATADALNQYAVTSRERERQRGAH